LAGFTLAGVREAVERAVEMGFGEYDYSAVYNAIHPAG
jgi:hypothetical protein